MSLGRFQMLEAQSFKGLGKENHIGSLYQTAAQPVSDIMIQLLAAKRGKSLENYLRQFPIKYFDTEDDYTWDVIGSSRRNIPLLEARTLSGSVISSGANAGVGEPFYLVFGEDWFGDGETIVGEKNEMYPLRILGQPRLEGTNAVYKVELMGGVTTGIPVEEIQAGKRFSFDYAVVERSFSKGVGAVRYTSPVAMRNEWTKIRIKSEVGGSMLNRRLKAGIPIVDNAGNRRVETMWMHYEEFKVEETFSEYKNNAIMYGRSNRTNTGEYLNLGKSGEVIRQGMGLREQMEVANTEYYNIFNLNIINDSLFNLSSSKLDFSERKFILRTGERGAAQFHKAVLDVVSGWSAIGYLGGNAANPAIISRTSSNLHQNALAAGFQFVEFRAPNGVIVKVEVDPLYDDPIRNKIMHPQGGVAMSYRYDIMDIGSMEQPNIQICKIKGQEEIRGYMWGMRNPYTGAINNGNMSYEDDKASFHRMTTLGVVVLDPTRTVSIIPQILA